MQTIMYVVCTKIFLYFSPSPLLLMSGSSYKITPRRRKCTLPKLLNSVVGVD